MVNAVRCQIGSVRLQADKPAEQKVVVGLIQQEPFRADAVKGLQQISQQLTAAWES
jgi:hypothetical protein